MQKTCFTKNLMLRTLDAADAEKVLQYFDRNRAFLKQWEPVRDEEFYTADYHRVLLEAEQAEMDAGRMIKFWIFKKHEPERVIGSIAFSNIVRGSFWSCFLGYRLDAQEAGKGYMTEAVRKGAELMFSEYGLHRIEANIIPRNAASLRVVTKAGFSNEGLSPRYLKINGVWEDHIHMVLLNDSLE